MDCPFLYIIIWKNITSFYYLSIIVLELLHKYRAGNPIEDLISLTHTKLGNGDGDGGGEVSRQRGDQIKHVPVFMTWSMSLEAERTARR